MRFFHLAAGVLAAWTLLDRLVWAAGTGPGPVGPRRVPVSEANLIRNGTFEQDKTAWASNAIGTHVSAGYGRDGPGLQLWPAFHSHYGSVFQELHLPSRTTAATLSFNYRFVPGAGASLAFFRARLVKPAGDLATLLQVTLYPGDDWQTAHIDLDPGQLAVLNAERAAGSRVHLLFELSAQFLYVNLDQVAFRVSGETDRPVLQGSIAYVGLDENGYAQTVNRVDPNGGRPQVLWTHHGSFPVNNTIGDVAWRPDALELAFTSNHEAVLCLNVRAPAHRFAMTCGLRIVPIRKRCGP